ncbi:hypothetical protein ACFY1L_03195 [Streptomyces sp. NPDC001663]|uniref:hypothetical protein n=1 Tax=Streptomyces sp. NPDC001663 TaxID=3364597 RepID=UPI0036ABCBF6
MNRPAAGAFPRLDGTVYGGGAGVRRRVTTAGRCLSFLLALGFVALLASCGVPDGANKGPEDVEQRPRQADLQASIVNDRKHLFDGSLAYDPAVSVNVGESLTYDVRLTARGEKSGRAAQAALVTRAFQVGGEEGATLASGSRQVRIVLLGDGSEQAIAQPGEDAAWQWSVSADEPGDYDLALTVTTYQGDSNLALDTLHPPIKIHLTVHNTWSHRIDSMNDWLITASGVATALVAIYALRAPLTEFVRTRGEARRQRDQSRDGYM